MNNQIKCPNCGQFFDVEDVIYHQAEEKLKRDYEQKMQAVQHEMAAQKAKLKAEMEAFELKKEKENELFNERLGKKIQEEKLKLKLEAEKEKELELNTLKEELEKRKNENTELKKRELALLQQEQQLKEKQEEMQLTLQRELLEKRQEIEQQIKIKEQEKNELRIKEYEKKLDDQKKLIEEMQRKAEQGSMQLQGEVQELALEELLKREFPFDIIEEVGKGVRGADARQTVMNMQHQACGIILFESKRTKAFSEQWIEKLKEDQRNAGASLAVIVTETMPKDMDKFGRKDGVWICTFAEVLSLVFVLREMLLREFSARSAEEGKADKMTYLYNYLVSEEFRGRVEAIVEGFSTLKSEMEREKRAMQRIWKERDKQIEKVIGNTIDMYGAIRGIAGNSVKEVKALSLNPSDDEQDDLDQE